VIAQIFMSLYAQDTIIQKQRLINNGYVRHKFRDVGFDNNLFYNLFIVFKVY
jgi:hypothetical protein